MTKECDTFVKKSCGFNLFIFGGEDQEFEGDGLRV